LGVQVPPSAPNKGFDMDNYNFLSNESFLIAKNNNQHYYFGNIDLNLLSWEDVIFELENHIQNYDIHKVCNNLRFILMNPKHDKILKFIQHYQKIEPNLRSNAHLYVAFLTNSGGNGRHKDNEHIIFWQVVGKTHWILETNNGIKEYILNPNEALYIPPNMYHTVITLTPRAGISFGLENDKC
jgi:ribosomal protein L16 Arg81 hydroxylase